MSAFPINKPLNPTLTSGCRAQPGGLHLGHYYGSFHGVPANETIYFVISDVVGDLTSNEKAVIQVARDAIAASRMARVNIVISRESKLREQMHQLIQALLLCTTFRELAEALPKRHQAKSGLFTGTANDFLFPVYQSAYLIALGTSVACYNDDNKRFVDLTRRLARRCNQRLDTSFIETTRLIERSPGRLAGWNGDRMAKINKNELLFCSNLTSIRRFCQRLVGRASANESNFDRSAPSEIEHLYYNVFQGNLALDGVLGLSGMKRILFLSNILHSFLRQIEVLTPDDEETRRLLLAGEESTLEAMSSTQSIAGL